MSSYHGQLVYLVIMQFLYVLLPWNTCMSSYHGVFVCLVIMEYLYV